MFRLKKGDVNFGGRRRGATWLLHAWEENVKEISVKQEEEKN